MVRAFFISKNGANIHLADKYGYARTYVMIMFRNLSVRFNLASYRFISGQPIHGAAARGRTDALLTLIAWGAAGNERKDEGSVIRRIFFT